MSRRGLAPWVLVVVLGAATFIILHIHFVTAWEQLYAPAPWPGFEAAARRGLIDPWFGSSPRSLRVTQTVLLVLATVVGVMRSGEGFKSGLALWVGVMIPLIPVLFIRLATADTTLVTLSPMTGGEITWLSLPLEAVRTAAPIFLGIFAGMLVRWLFDLVFRR